MYWTDILQDIRNIESQTMELKPSFSDMDAIGRTMAAFSTAQGGKIYVGIDNKGNPVGVQCDEKIKERINNLAREVNPIATINLNLTHHDSDKNSYICCIKVEKGKGEVYAYKNVPYERRGDINHPLSPAETVERGMNARKMYFDDLSAQSEDRPALLSDIDETKVKQFLMGVKNVRPDERTDVKQFLQNNRLFYNGGMNVKNAAIMLFGKDIKRFVPQAKVELIEFPSTEVAEGGTFQKKDIQNDLINMVYDTGFEIEKRVSGISFVRDYQRIDIPTYPREALREAIVNAIAHRDYRDRSSNVSIKIFKDRIEISNPAIFPFDNHSWEDIQKKGVSVRRNPIIAEFFEDLHLMEKRATGIARIRIALEKHRLPPPKIEVSSNIFKITMHNILHTAPEKMLESPYKIVRDAKGINERQKAILDYLQAQKVSSINRGEYMSIVGANEKTAMRDLENLVNRGLMRRYGEKRGTRYLVIWQA